MSLAALHDGFTVYVPSGFLKRLGFVPQGEARSLIDSGELAKGPPACNTHGGNLSEGRLQGAGGIVEQSSSSGAGERQFQMHQQP